VSDLSTMFRMALVGIVLFIAVVPAGGRAEDEGGGDIEELKHRMLELESRYTRELERLRSRIAELEAERARQAEPQTSRTGSQARHRLEAGYKKGLYVRSADGAWALKLATRIQLRYFVERFDSSRNKDTEHSFQVRRLRLTLSGHAFRPWIHYKIQLAADKGHDLTGKDYYVDLVKYRAAALRLGQYKVPFNAEELTSSSALAFVDRSIVGKEFSFGRDIGVMAHGIIGRMVDYGVGVFNGAGPNAADNPDGDFVVAGRVEFYPLGRFKLSQADLRRGERRVRLRLAAAALAAPGLNPGIESTGGEAADRCAELGSATCDVVQFTVDAQLKYRGASAEVEYHARSIDPAEDGLDGADAWGLRMQAGYVFASPGIGVGLRYAYVDEDNPDVQRWELTPALSYYFHGHRLKLQGDYSLLHESAVGVGRDDNRVRLQLQLYF